MTSLNKTIKNLPNPESLPHELPIVHMSNAKWFVSICEQGHLKPRECKVFKKNLLYFFYGGAFYRSVNKSTEDPLKLPVVFMFAPNLLNEVATYFPFDSGAAEAGKYGDTWSQKLRDFDKYCVSGEKNIKIPCKLVYYIYGSNENYLDGNFKPDLTKLPEPFPELHRFLKSDITQVGCDHRKYIIECQVEQQVDLLSKNLMWVAFPEEYINNFFEFCQKFLEGHVPQYLPYRYHRTFNPSHIEYLLYSKAEEVIKERYLKSAPRSLSMNPSLRF